MKISRESWILIAIGIADLVSTILLIQGSGAQEANPIFKKLWEHGVLTFILGKALWMGMPIAVLEWARRRRPRFVRRALRGAIVLYLGLYGVGFVRLNGTDANAAELAESRARRVDAAVASLQLSLASKHSLRHAAQFVVSDARVRVPPTPQELVAMYHIALTRPHGEH